MSGKARPSLRAKTLYNVSHYSGLSQTDKECIAEVFRKYGDYEDTGLTPKAAERLKLASMGKALAEIKEFEGVPINRLRELAEAVKDGRVIVTDAPPAAAVVPIVHCKECRYWQDNNGGYPCGECKWRGDETPDADDYCSEGERE